MNEFRVWDNVRKEWIKNVDIIMDSTGKIFAGDLSNPPMVKIEPEFVFFSTGLLDKKGNIVYDNSLIIWEIDNGVGIEQYSAHIVWSERTELFKGEFRWLVKYEEGKYDDLSHVCQYMDSIQVVGSVQEDL